MRNKKLEKVLTSIIESHIMEVVDVDDQDSLLEVFDVDLLADKISHLLTGHSLSRKNTPDINDQKKSYMCSKCYRPYGVWVADNGTDIPEVSLTIDGKKIVILDDI